LSVVVLRAKAGRRYPSLARARVSVAWARRVEKLLPEFAVTELATAESAAHYVVMERDGGDGLPAECRRR
jgi:hypothetical protein